mmetsp:Transcript_33042/g.104548  ORF Transcript_33042/g.104548 Transcript_33042/m.104548 type:complete len:539 (+) Transcript_33042:125-1741(+)
MLSQAALTANTYFFTQKLHPYPTRAHARRATCAPLSGANALCGLCLANGAEIQPEPLRLYIYTPRLGCVRGNAKVRESGGKDDRSLLRRGSLAFPLGLAGLLLGLALGLLDLLLRGAGREVAVEVLVLAELLHRAGGRGGLHVDGLLLDDGHGRGGHAHAAAAGAGRLRARGHAGRGRRRRGAAARGAEHVRQRRVVGVLVLEEGGERRRHHVIDDPVDAEAAGHIEGEPAHHEGQHVEQRRREALGLRLRVRREDLLRDLLRDHEDDGDAEEAERVVPAEHGRTVLPRREPLERFALLGAVGRALEAREPQEGLRERVLLGELEDGAVERDEDGDLRQRRQAARERVHAGLLVEVGDHLVRLLGVVPELGLDILHHGVDGLHLRRALELLGVQRERQRLDAEREQDDGRAVRVLNPGALEPVVDAPDGELRRADERPERAAAGLGRVRRRVSGVRREARDGVAQHARVHRAEGRRSVARRHRVQDHVHLPTANAPRRRGTEALHQARRQRQRREPHHLACACNNDEETQPPSGLTGR